MKEQTPKNTTNGRVKAMVKEILMSLVATTISIILTFGTAAWLEGRKKEEAKREMVMMILCDLAGNIAQAEKADSLLRQGFELQLAVAKDSALLLQNPFLMAQSVPHISYTETVEQIFSSSIETINTLGNVLFTENISDIYRLRKQYKETICDKFMQDLDEIGGFTEYSQVMRIRYASEYIYTSGLLLCQMKEKLAQCQQLMGVSEADFEAYLQKRQEMATTSATDSIQDALLDEASLNLQRLKDAQVQGKEQPSKE